MSTEEKKVYRIIGVYIYMKDGVMKRFMCDDVQNDRLVDEVKIFKDHKLIAIFFKAQISGFEIIYKIEEDNENG